MFLFTIHQLVIIWSLVFIKYEMDDHNCPKNRDEELQYTNNFYLIVNILK